MRKRARETEGSNRTARGCGGGVGLDTGAVALNPLFRENVRATGPCVFNSTFLRSTAFSALSVELRQQHDTQDSPGCIVIYFFCLGQHGGKRRSLRRSSEASVPKAPRRNPDPEWTLTAECATCRGHAPSVHTDFNGVGGVGCFRLYNSSSRWADWLQLAAIGKRWRKTNSARFTNVELDFGFRQTGPVHR